MADLFFHVTGTHPRNLIGALPAPSSLASEAFGAVRQRAQTVTPAGSGTPHTVCAGHSSPNAGSTFLWI